MNEMFLVAATKLNVRQQPALEGAITGQIVKGSRVARTVGGADDLWWYVKAVDSTLEGFVARRYLVATDAAAKPVLPGVNEILWARSRAAHTPAVLYKLGDKDSSQGRIDCSGWVAELTIAAFKAVNAAAAPDSVFDQYDHAALRTHSDGQIANVEARTGFILHGADVTATNLREGMLIGCNNSSYAWERNNPPRRYGIDHIVQVVRDPAGGQLCISQSSSSGHGVTIDPLDVWLRAQMGKGLMASNRIHAVDPFQMADPHSAAYAGLASTPAPSATPPAPVPATVQPGQRAAFSGRGAYVYATGDLLRQYGSLETAVREMQRCRLNHVWVRIHGRGYIGEARNGDLDRQKGLVALARRAGIAVAGWGWCQGEDPEAEAALALRAMAAFDLQDYVADIEQGVNDARWTAEEAGRFAGKIRPGAAGFAVSSHGFIEYHDPAVLKGCAPLVDCFSPQAYWDTEKPNAKMLAFAHATPADYPLRNPAAYARLCHDRWKACYGKPIVLTGQTAPEGEFTAAEAEDRLQTFLAAFVPPADLVGLNYWHWGGTSRSMRDALAAHPGPF